MKHNKYSFALIIFLIVLASAFLVVRLTHNLTTKNAVQGINSKTVTLHNTVSVTFPCSTHVTSLQPKTATPIISWTADCGTYADNGRQGFIYTAALEKYPSGSTKQQVAYNYCIAQSSYPGATSGSIIYILKRISQTVANKRFNVCTLSADKVTAYEATGRAEKENYVLILNVDVNTPIDATTLLAKAQEFVDTARFK